jgi:hypothetical protein
MLTSLPSAVSSWAVAHKDQLSAFKTLAELVVLLAVIIAIVVYVIRDPRHAPEQIIKRA